MIKLKKGDIVDIIAPASFAEAESLFKACDQLKKWGLVPRTFIDFDAFHPFHSDEDEIRFIDLKRALYASDSKVIWCLRGGYGSARLLGKLSKLPKPKKEKILIGYSDITSLHAFLNQSWGWESIHGPMISSFNNSSLDPRAMKELKNILFAKIKSASFKLKPLNTSAEESKKSIEGAVVGGNLALIQALIGTKYQLRIKNKILVIEDVSERGYRIDRMLQHLTMSGILKGVSAIIFGDFTEGQEPGGENFVEFALMRFAQDLKIPVFKTNEFGHGKINRPLIFNRNYKISKNILSVKI